MIDRNSLRSVLRNSGEAFNPPSSRYSARTDDVLRPSDNFVHSPFLLWLGQAGEVRQIQDSIPEISDFQMGDRTRLIPVRKISLLIGAWHTAYDYYDEMAMTLSTTEDSLARSRSAQVILLESIECIG